MKNFLPLKLLNETCKTKQNLNNPKPLREIARESSNR